MMDLSNEYKYGFAIDLKDCVLTFPRGLNENIIRRISALKNEPQWLLKYRLDAYEVWKSMPEPMWSDVIGRPDVNYQDVIYYSALKDRPELDSLEEVEPELRRYYELLGLPVSEQKRLANVAMDVIMDSESVVTTCKEELLQQGIIFCSFSEAVDKYPELVRKHLGSVVPPTDNFYAALNAAVFSDGTFVYIPEGVSCPMELSSYFRINEAGVGQFERTLIVAEDGSSVFYNEGCTAPERKDNQLHAAVVEIVAMKKAVVNYSTVQNWFGGDINGDGGIYNFVTKRALCKGDYSFVSWVQVETGSARTWKYPSCVLLGDYSKGEFYSVAITKNHQRADTGTKMIHLGKGTRSNIVSKGISTGNSINGYRGLVKTGKGCLGAENKTCCDSLILGSGAAVTFPRIDTIGDILVEHEATTSRVSEEKTSYLMQRGLSEEEATSMIVGGFCKDVLSKLPLEFAAEARKLLEIEIEGAIG